MPEPFLLLLTAATFLLAGLVKGVIGLGLPTVSLALLTITIGLTEALAIMLVPSLVTNLWQALRGSALKAILRRFWAFLLIGAGTTILATSIIPNSDPEILKGLLGLLICLYAASGLSAAKWPAPQKNRGLWAAAMGLLSGLCTGLTGSFVVPAVAYFQALNLDKNTLVQTMGVWFSIATLSLAIGLSEHDLLPRDLGLLSLAGLPPALVGMYAGEIWRHKLSETSFKKAFYAGLFAVGLFIVGRTLA